MKRKIITIDQELCNGCKLCVNACHEGALQLVNGKATLISETYCDGLGDCLPECPTGAITLEERETVEYDEEAVKIHLNNNSKETESSLSSISLSTQGKPLPKAVQSSKVVSPENSQSQLAQWPCQLKLVSIDAPYFDNADILLAADCTAFAYPNIHQQFMLGKVTLIACPKLDNIDYSEKLSEIIKRHSISSITILKMEVPCCGGLVNAAKKALANSNKSIPYTVATISTNGLIL
ncbi:4Fe-4S binding protein [Desulfosporosinus sp. FKB]|uniref:ATP-binding protein n=1 Tax=Desulfosporosinus sp. FKB TaxID=1969835 RepID=UPI000B49D6E9|nr:4Fe-4S binding protein [Desulfosporosinus sp. FKB]